MLVTGDGPIMPEIARLDDDGILIGVDHCVDADHKTDPLAKTVKLDDGHDVRNMIKLYRWNFNRNTFEPLTTEPLEVAERDTSELVEGILEAIEDIWDFLDILSRKVRDKNNKDLKPLRPSQRTKRVFSEFRRHTPRIKQPKATSDEVNAEMDVVITESGS